MEEQRLAIELNERSIKQEQEKLNEKVKASLQNSFPTFILFFNLFQG
jgi:hypothetical protein